MKFGLLEHLAYCILFVPALMTWSCGEQPAFRDAETRQNNSDAKAGHQVDNLDQETNEIDTSQSQNIDTDSQAHSNTETESNSEVESSGSKNTATSDIEAIVGSNNNAGGAANGGKSDDILEEDGGNLIISGTKIQRVGINFEDGTDFDFNDAVICFEGFFKMEGTEVVSYKQQTVVAKTFSASACDHRIDIRIHHDDGSTDSFSFRSDIGKDVSLPFRIKSKLDVTMTTIYGGCDQTPVSMHNQQYTVVKANVCNDSGT